MFSCGYPGRLKGFHQKCEKVSSGPHIPATPKCGPCTLWENPHPVGAT